MLENAVRIGRSGPRFLDSRIARAALLALAVAITLATAPSAQAGGACAPVCKTGPDGQRYAWTPGKT
jgi:hypothetical protein